MQRRPLITWLAAAAALPAGSVVRAAPPTPETPPRPLPPAASAASDAVQDRGVSRRTLRFPADHGAHADVRTEWWYLTGHLHAAGATGEAAATPEHGFQLTFFRTRTGFEARGSRFAARQLIAVHAALTDLRQGRLHHVQRLARAGFGIAEAARGDTRVHAGSWRLERQSGAPAFYRAVLDDAEFAFDLHCTLTQPPLLQGLAGWSQKGPDPAQASHYYSVPQLAVAGTLRAGRRAQAVAGRAWLDHEWSQTLLDPAAVGWDWIGMNLEDGSALTAFRLRRSDGSTLHAGGSHRPAGGAVQAFATGAVDFQPERTWTSAATQARYPVVWRVQTPAGRHTVRALLDAQEVDARASTGTIYWEGLAELLDASGRRVGLGYLELTGYAGRLAI